MLIHHSTQNYEEAAGEAAAVARRKLEALIDTGRERGRAVVDQVQTQVIDDRVARGTALAFAPADGALEVSVGGGRHAVHPFAMRQVLAEAKMPKPYYDHLLAQGAWGADLVAENLNRTFAHDPEYHLLRSVGPELRGFLSRRYGRRDPGLILDAFLGACTRSGALPFEGYAGDTKIALKAILPRVFEPVRHEVLAFFVVLEESSFGNGPTLSSVGILRLACTNQAVWETNLRRVHLGGELSDDVEWSDKVYRKHSEAIAAQIEHLVVRQLAPGTVHQTLAAIRRADEARVTPGEFESFLKRSTTRPELEAITETFNSADVINLPAGQTRWRMSNAISFFAQRVEDAERRLELGKLAGAALQRGG